MICKAATKGAERSRNKTACAARVTIKKTTDATGLFWVKTKIAEESAINPAIKKTVCSIKKLSGSCV